MSKKFLFFVVFCIAVCGGFAQQQTADGGYVISGQTMSYMTGTLFDDAFVYKLDAGGNVSWFENYGGVMPDGAEAVIQTSDGGYALAGFSISFTYPDIAALAYKLTSSGTVQWRTTISDHDQFYWARKIRQTVDGGYVVIGDWTDYLGVPKGIISDNQIFLTKLDGSGNVSWTKFYGGVSQDLGRDVRQTADGGYIIGARSYSYTHGSADYLVYKVNASGQKQWRKNYGGISIDDFWSLAVTPDGGYVLAGDSYSYSKGSCDLLVYKVNASGQKQWRKNFGGDNSDNEGFIETTTDGGYILAGSSWSFSNGGEDFLLYKLNASGQKQWRKNFGGINAEYATAVFQTSDGGYGVYGTTYSYTHGGMGSDVLIYKLNAAGQKQWRQNHGGTDYDWADAGL